MPNREQRRGSLASDDTKIYIESAGLPYEISLGALSALDEKDYYTQVGHTIMDLFTGQASFSTFAVAGLVWVWRRRHGERTLTFQEVAGEFKMSDLETLRVGDDEEAESGTLSEPSTSNGNGTYDGKDPEHSGELSAPSSQDSPQSMV